MMSKAAFVRLVRERALLPVNEATFKNLARELRLMLACEDICSKEFPKNKEVCIQHCIQFFKLRR